MFGPPFPDKIGDEFLCTPQTSYGAQKAISELLLSDFIRKGFCDGFSIRLPTICVRPGKPSVVAQVHARLWVNVLPLQQIFHSFSSFVHITFA